ncbi:hypothetical protein [Streptomyces altiplanensis]
MTAHQRGRIRARAAAALTTAALALLLAGAAHHPGHLAQLLLTLTAALGAVTAVVALAAAFAHTTETRTAASQTLDLLLRLVPWYTHRG